MNSTQIKNSITPVFIRYLQGLDRVLEQIEKLPIHEQQKILEARLAPDMLNFLQQAETAIQFSLRTILPIANQTIPDFYIAKDISTLREKLQTRIDIIDKIALVSLPTDLSRTFVERAGEATIYLSLDEFVYEFSIPNFLFHVSMAYAIARASSINIGKGTYDGFHKY